MVAWSGIPPQWSYQTKGVEFIHYHGAVYLMLDMGMGKTRICIDAAKTKPYPMFILANKFAALDTWPDEFAKWNPSANVAVLHGPKKEQIWANSDKYTHIIMNYEGIPWFFKTANKKLRPLQKYFFVFDEASMLKNWDTKRWLYLQQMMPIMSDFRVALSGTPMPNSLADLWSQYYLLDGGQSLGKDPYGFRNRFFDYTGPDGDPPYLTTIKPGMEQKIYSLISRNTMRLDIEDYHDLPALVYNPVRISMPATLRRKYEVLEREFMLEFPNSTVIANSSATRDHKLRQFLQGAMYSTDNLMVVGERRRTVVEHLHSIKAQVVKQLLDVSAGRPMLLAVQFKFELEILEKVLGRKVPAITGATSAKQGRQNIQDWNAGKLPLLAVHPKSVAYSLNLQHGGSDLVFAALPWELDLYQQLLKRLHRPGQTADRVTVHLIAFKNSVDDKVATYLRRKEHTQDGLFKAILRRAA